MQMPLSPPPSLFCVNRVIDVRFLCVRDCRWDRQVHEMRRAITSLPSQMMLAAGFCTYLSKTPEV